MINPISFLWRQFTGSQVNAIATALWQYFKDSFDGTLEYYRNLKIANANDDHLTWIGILQGVARPLIPLPDESYFLFTETYGYEEGDGAEPETWYAGHMIPDSGLNPRGFGSVNNSEGGRLTDVKGIGDYEYIPATIFRAVLRANSSSSGVLGSLVVLDDILYTIWRIDHLTTPPVYTFTFANRQANPRNTPGDIFANLGVTGDWKYPYETQAEVHVLGNTVYYPMPKLIPVLREGDSQIDPIGLIRILLRTDESVDPVVYGLDAMWAGEGTPSDTVNDGEEPEWDLSPLTVFEVMSMWNTDQDWLDDPDPSEEFVALTTADLNGMW